MIRILGIDYGERRIGLAISDPLQIIATPLKVVDRKKTPKIFQEIKDLVKEKNISTVVVGFPLTMKGTFSKQTEATVEFIEKLKELLEVPIYTVDERMTSKEAEKILIQKGIKTGHNKSAVDQTSAIIILQEYLDSK